MSTTNTRSENAFASSTAMKNLYSWVISRQIPAAFSSGIEVPRYGPGPFKHDAISSMRTLTEQDLVQQMHAKARLLKDRLFIIKPMMNVRPRGWLDILLGRANTQRVRLKDQVVMAEAIFAEMARLNIALKNTVARLDRAIDLYDLEAGCYKVYIDAGRQYLNENVDAGHRSTRGDCAPVSLCREAFIRRVAVLTTLNVSRDRAVEGFIFQRSQMVSATEAFELISKKTFSHWQKNIKTMITATSLPASSIASLTLAHDTTCKLVADLIRVSRMNSPNSPNADRILLQSQAA